MSSLNITDMFVYIQELNYDKERSLIPNTVLLFCVVILAVFGNGLVLFVYTFKLNLKLKTDDRYFIPWLSVLDMIAGIMGSSLGLIYNFNPLNAQSSLVCTLIWTGNTFAVLSSGIMLVAIAVQRYLKVCKPFNSSMTLVTYRIVVIIIGTGSLLLSVPCIFLYGKAEVVVKKIIEYNITGYSCGLLPNHNISLNLGYSVILFLIFVVGLMSLSALYFLILRKIYQQESFWKKKKSKQTTSKYHVNSHCSTTKTTEIDTSVEQSDHRSSLSTHTDNHAERGTRVSFVSSASTEPEAQNQSLSCTESRTTGICRRIMQKYRISIMCVLIAVISVISFLPRLILMIVEGIITDFWDNLTDNEFVFYLSLYRLYLLNNVVNPFIYFIFDTSFKRACYDIFSAK